MLAPSPPANLPAAQPAPKFHDVKIVTKKTYRCARVEGVPPEEFGIARNARTLRDCGYCYHEVVRRVADLTDEGFDAEQLKTIPSYTGTTKTEIAARDTVGEQQGASGDEALNQANREIRITEHYVRMDYEGDGKARLYRVTTGGDDNVILIRDGEDDVVEVDEIPFAAMTPVIMTHRFYGRSIADLIMDIQRIKTALLRGALDNMYLHLNPRVEVSESHASDNTLDDLLVSRPGGIVRTKQPGGLNWQEVPDITPSIYPQLQYWDATREWRTGVSRQGQGVDPNALQNQVATIANQMFNAAQARIKLIARIFAETGIRDLFSLLHGIIRKNGSQPQTVRLRNQWVNVDPRDWKERNDLTINVGLGDGTKAEKLAGAQLMIGAQEKGIAAGVVSKMNLYESAKELTKLLGHKDCERFFTAPDPNDSQSKQPIPPPPNPDMEKLQAEYQLKQQDANHRNQLETTQAQADIATNQQKTAAEIAREDRQAMLEERRAEREHEFKMQELEFQMQARREQHAATMAQTAAKGEGGGGNASIEVKHSADEMTAPLAGILTGFSQHLANMQENNTKIMADAVSKMNRPKRVRKNKDGSWQTEAVD